jgi:DNA-binding transcriptional regulator YiaG
MDKFLANLTKMRKENNNQISNVRNKKGEIPKTLRKSRESSETTLKTYIPINWKTLKKWKNSRYL